MDLFRLDLEYEEAVSSWSPLLMSEGIDHVSSYVLKVLLESGLCASLSYA